MARTFRRPRQSHPIAEMNLTNLIDLGFTLLIIFMITTPLMNQEQSIPVNLPTESRLSQPKTEKTEYIRVSVDARGRFYLESESIPVTLTELQTRLRHYGQRPKPPVVRIRGDAKATWDRMSDLMAELQKANLTRFTFDNQIAGR